MIAGFAVIGWIVVGLATGLLLPVGAIMAYVLGVSWALVVLYADRTGLASDLSLGRSQTQTLRLLIGVVAATALIAMGLKAADASGSSAFALLGASVGLSLWIYASVCLLARPRE